MRTGIAIAVGIIVTLAVGTAPVAIARPDAWFAALAKPTWNPPSAAFGIVWPVLFVLMGTAAGLAWTRRPSTVVPYAVQLAFNAAWSVIFFRYHQIAVALAEIVVLWSAILFTLLAFARARPVAGWLMVPYLAWVTFAVALNAGFWRLNP